MSDRTIIEGDGAESPREPKTLIEGGGSGTPPDGRTLLEGGTPAGQSPSGISSIHLAPGIQIAGCVLREQLRVISGEADLWIAEQPGRQELAVLKVFRWGVQPKAEVAEKLRRIPKAQVVEVLGSGVLSDGRHYELLEYIQGGTLANLMQPGGVSPSLARQVLLELTEALTEVHVAGILHRDLKPSNILIRHREPLDLVLTDFGISSLSDQTSLYVTGAHRTPAYSAPEAMTGVIGSSSDWWSVGVMLLELLTGRHLFAGMDERFVNFQLVSRGIEVPASVSEEWQLVLKGLLTRDHQKRWGGEQVRAWLSGQRDIPVFYQTGQQQATQYKPYKFMGKDRATPGDLAREAGQAKNWDEGVKSLQRRYIQDWVKQDVRDFDLLSKLQDIEDDKKLDWEQKFCAALLVLDTELPLCWRGEIITHDWISEQATQGTQPLNQALALLTSSLPEWLQRSRHQSWMLDLRNRRQRLQTEVGGLELNLARGDVDKVNFLPFEAVSAEAKRRKEIAYGPATEADEQIKALLAKPEWNEVECVAVVACPFSRFLTKEQRWLEVKRAAELDVESFFRSAKALNTISELQTVDLLLAKLSDSLEGDFTNLSQPVPFHRGDEKLRERIEVGSQVCRRRIRLKKRTRRMVFVSSLSLVALCAIIVLHSLLLGKTSLSFAFSFDGKDFPVGKSPAVTVDGKPFVPGEKIPLGHHHLTVKFAGGEPFTKTFWSFYGENDLGLLPLESSKGSLFVAVKPSPASVIVLRDGQLVKQADAPFKLDKLSVGDYSLAIRRGEYQETHPVRIERERETKANIELNLGSAALTSNPADADFELSGNNRRWSGKLPARVDDVPGGNYSLVIHHGEYQEIHPVKVERQRSTEANIALNLGSAELSSGPADAEFELSGNNRRWQGKLPTRIDNVPGGDYQFIVRRNGWELGKTVTVSRGKVTAHKTEFQYASIEVTSDPSGMVVSTNGVEIAKTPTTLQELKPGQYALTATDGENDLIATVTVGPKEGAKHNFLFRYGSLRLSSMPTGASVIRNGKELGRTPLTLARIPTGETTLQLKLPGYLTTNVTIHAAEDIITAFTSGLISERYVEALQKAARHFDSLDYSSALKEVGIAISENPDSAEATALAKKVNYATHLSAAESSLRLGEYALAEQNLQSAKKYLGDTAEIQSMRSKISSQKEPEFQKLIAAANQNFENNKFGETSRLLEKAKQLFPNHIDLKSLEAKITRRFDLAKGSGVLARGLAAEGGDKHWPRVRSVNQTFKVSQFDKSKLIREGTQKIHFQPPDNYREQTDLKDLRPGHLIILGEVIIGDLTSTIEVRGNSGTRLDSNGRKPLSESEISSYLNGCQPACINLMKSASQFSVDSSNTSPISLILLRDLNGYRTKLVFAQDTGLLQQTERLKDVKGAFKSELRVDVLEHNTVNGIVVPSRIVIYQNDHKIGERILLECSFR